MDFRLTSDQEALVSAVDKLAQQFEHKPTDAHGFVLFGAELERELDEGQYFDIAAVPELGTICAAMAVERLARLPYTVECALSMLVRPHLPGEWPRPIALLENDRPARFLAGAKTIIVIDGESIGVAPAPADGIAPVDSLFAYPMARLTRKLDVQPLSEADAETVRQWIRVALAAEASGLMRAAIDSTVEHLSSRKQFGRPLGTFQALRHRMAECAVLAGGVRWLMLKAAGTGDAGDAALAASHAQESAARLVYDLHQMLGAMGMTLEHPLHLWTYRLKALLSELGGRGGQARAVARYCFGKTEAVSG
jgi:hypothetical protein